MARVMFEGPEEWIPDCDERFPACTASHGNATESRLARSWGRSYVSTAISPDGDVVAAATLTEVQIYLSEYLASTAPRRIHVHTTLKINFVFQKEKIRAVALSDSLLVVLTYNRLIVYGYGEGDDVNPKAVVDEIIDQNDDWTPNSLSISEKNQGRLDDIWAWIAVGGDGVNGVKLFKLLLKGHWILQRNDMRVLHCTQNTGSVKLVGFSPNQSNSPYTSIVVGVTTTNEVYFWDLRRAGPSHQMMMPTWRIVRSSIPNVPVSEAEDHFW